jgi:AsmA-like C-terminal region/AsmA family
MISKPQKRLALAAIAIFVIAAFIVPAINVGRYRSAVARSLSAAIGREVTVRDVSMHLLPSPGLTLSGLVVADDPRFSAEPVLRADEVTAALRLSSLWRGRLEISQLSLNYPSLNLVRLPDGEWNVESLFEHVREMPAAPTSKKRPEYRARFPYIESSGGRINLKLGLEKTVYALNDADFALWLASEDEWRTRLEARPMRTDANLSDTGLVRVDGSAHRAASLAETPLQLHLNWSRGQLGQITTLLRGRDAGWRGSVQLNVNLTGTPRDLHVVADSTVEDFRRYDIFATDSLTLFTHCTAKYSNMDHTLSDAVCLSPIGAGQILARGTAQLTQPRVYDVAFSLSKIPVQFAVSLARHTKLGMSNDLSAVGTLDGEFAFKTVDGQNVWSGTGATSELEFRSKQLGETPLSVSAIQFGAGHSKPAEKSVTIGQRNVRAASSAQPATLLGLQPFTFNLGASTPATVSGWITTTGYHVEMQSEVELKRALQVSSAFGLYASANPIDGEAKLAAELNGSWTQFQAPTLTGKGQLHNVTAAVAGFATPVRIVSADLVADDNRVALQNVTLSFSPVHIAATGSFQVPRHCQPSPDCAMSFELRSDSIALDDLNRLVNPKAWSRPWYERLVGGNNNPNAPWGWLYAKGHIAAQKFLVKGIPATKATTQISISPGSTSITDFHASVFGGTYQGEFTINSENNQPAFQSKGQFDRVSMSELASLMKDGWATGTISLSYEGSAAGWLASDFLNSTAATANFDWRNGSLPHITLASEHQPLAIQRFEGELQLKNGEVSISEGKLQNHAGIYQISGTATLARDLKMTLTRDSGSAYSVTGTLARPKVAPVEGAAKQASLRSYHR